MDKTFANSSLKMRSTARTVLLAMAEDAERAERLRAVKRERPALKWRHFAEAADVKERTVLGWAKTGQLSYEHAKEVAELANVDLDWLWRGPDRESPDLMGALSPSAATERLERIEQKVDELLALALERELADAEQATRRSAGTATGRSGSRKTA